jgi:hypothetical protein
LNIYCRLHGLQPENIDRQFRTRSGIFRIVNVMPSRPKFAIEGECVHTGRRLLFTPAGVNAGLLPVPVPA